MYGTAVEFKFLHNGQEVTIRGFDIEEARITFKARYGYYPSSSQIVQQ